MFLRSHVFCRLTNGVRTIRTVLSIKQHVLKNFPKRLTHGTNDSESNGKVGEKCSASGSVSDDCTGYQVATVSENNRTALQSIKDANANQTLELITNTELTHNDLHSLDDILAREKKLGPLDVCEEDLTAVGPFMEPTYTFAKYADKSRTVQELVKLGVQLYRLESNSTILQFFLIADFDKEIKPYIQFLTDCGLPPERLSFFITKNPMIFKQDMDDLRTRIRYLRAHNFSIRMIKDILYKNPYWLSFAVKDIDARLCYFQTTFHLSGNETRQLASTAPNIITTKMAYLQKMYFAVSEEMGFTKKETKTLILTEPRIWRKGNKFVVDTFDYVHNEMKLSHSAILKEPRILVHRKNRVKCRHMFLKHLKRAQYDPSKPMYVSLNALINSNDAKFCIEVARSNIETYNLFLKTL